MTDWDARWLELAAHVAGWSKDRHTKVGCVIVGEGRRLLAEGYNGLPRGVDDSIEKRYSRDVRNGRREKLRWTEHAERNAIFSAAYHGISLRHSTLYTPLYPCADCTRGIIQSGIAMVVTTEPGWDDEFWGPEFGVSEVMMREAGVRVRLVVPSRSRGEVPGH